MKQRTRLKFELAGFWPVDIGAGDVARQQIRGEPARSLPGFLPGLAGPLPVDDHWPVRQVKYLQ
mgnify:CR=1 FL=1